MELEIPVNLLTTCPHSFPVFRNCPSHVVEVFQGFLKLYPEEKLIIPFAQVHQELLKEEEELSRLAAASILSPKQLQFRANETQTFHSSYLEILLACVKLVDFTEIIWRLLVQLEASHAAQDKAASGFLNDMPLFNTFTKKRRDHRNSQNRDEADTDTLSLTGRLKETCLSWVWRLWRRVYLHICITLGEKRATELLVGERGIARQSHQLISLCGQVKINLARLNRLSDSFLMHIVLPENRRIGMRLFDNGLMDLAERAKKAVSSSCHELNDALRGIGESF